MLTGCGGSSPFTSTSTSPPPPPPPTTGSLYAANWITASILRFSAGANGNISPQSTIKGASTQIPTSGVLLLADSDNDRLFVCGFSTPALVIFEHASSKTGNVAPDRVVAGAATTISSPRSLALDSANNLLYVDDSSNNHILVFGSASTINGNVAPVRTIVPGLPVGFLALDAVNNRLFVQSNNSINVYDGASTLNGAVAANRVISGASTQFDFPGPMQLDSAGRLFLANGTTARGTQSILVYANAGAANGNVAPSAVIAGPNTTLSSSAGLAVSPAGELFVGDAGSVMVFAPSATANGNIAPVRVLAGSNTGLFTTPGFGNVTSIAIDPNH